MKNVLIEMRRYRMGLIQTPEQLRFSYLAIIDGMKSQRPLANGTVGDEALAEDAAGMRQRKPTDTSPTNNNSAQERERVREERKRKTEETIRMIKDKSKELEQRIRFKSKMLKLGLIGAALLLGAGFWYGYYYWSGVRSPPHQPLQNLSL